MLPYLSWYSFTKWNMIISILTKKKLTSLVKLAWLTSIKEWVQTKLINHSINKIINISVNENCLFYQRLTIDPATTECSLSNSCRYGELTHYSCHHSRYRVDRNLLCESPGGRYRSRESRKQRGIWRHFNPCCDRGNGSSFRNGQPPSQLQ